MDVCRITDLMWISYRKFMVRIRNYFSYKYKINVLNNTVGIWWVCYKAQIR